MASKNFSGILRDPLGTLANNDKYRFTHVSTTGEVIRGSTSYLTIGDDGVYNIDIEYGNVSIESYSELGKRWIAQGTTTINADTTATTLPALLNALVPASDALILQLEALLADAESAASDAIDAKDTSIVQANIATDKANEALQSANESANKASISTTQANLAISSANSAAASESNALSSANSAESWASDAEQASANAGSAASNAQASANIATAASDDAEQAASEAQSIVGSFALKILQSPTEGLTEIQTRTVDANEVYEVRKTSDDSLATIYSDADGTTEIVQNGTDNKSGGDGVVEFYIADGDYTVTVDGVSSKFSVGTNECTVSDIASGLYSIGSRLTVTDRASATFNIVSGGTPNGFEVLDAGGGNTAVLEIDTMNIDPMQLGASGDAVIGEGIPNEGTNDDIYLQRAVDLAGTKKSDITNKIAQVTGQVVLKRLFAFTQLDIPSGVAVLGNPAFGGLVDIGTVTTRAAVEVGDTTLTTESAFCGLDGTLVKGNKTLNRVLVKYNLCLRKCFNNRTNIYNGWRNLETTTSWALEFKSNYIWGAVESCAVLDNGTANKWSDNRLEVAGEAVLVIDGSGGQEPVNVVLNGGSIQFGDKEGIKGIDIVTLESYGVFYEGNNKLGGYDFISIVKGGLGKSADLVLIKGGFFTQGGGAGGRAIYADAKTIIVETEIRGNGFTHGVVATPSTKYLDVKGIMPSVSNAVYGFNSDTCVVKIGLGDKESIESGVIQQKERRRNRTVGSNTTSQSLDYNVTCATTNNSVGYMLRDEDFQDGRTIILRKASTESVNSITVTPPAGKSVIGNSTKSDGMAVIEINILGNNAFCY